MNDLNLLKQLDLRKDIVLNLKKDRGLQGLMARVVLVLDKSGSMRDMYVRGFVQRVVERILPLGLAFDDNGEVELYLFHKFCSKAPENIMLYNIEGYVSDRILKNDRYGWAGTNYAPPINDIMRDFGNKKSGGGIFSKAKTEPADMPTYVIFITDGENDDKMDAEKSIREACGHGIYFQFVGIGNERFAFLKNLDSLSGRSIDNAGFFQVNNIDQMSDDQLYSELLKEFPTFVTEAKKLNLIK